VPHEHAGKLVNMKMDPKARQEKYAESVSADRPTYPYGLEVRLDNDALDKLGLDKLPQVGKPMMLYAKVDVTSVSENERNEGGKAITNRSVGLQITDLVLLPPAKEADAEGALYSAKK
jgi:hypothetical protein